MLFAIIYKIPGLVDKGYIFQLIKLIQIVRRCSGYLFKKVSKYAAATAVVGYLAVQVNLNSYLL